MYHLGIDIGSSSIKAALVEISSGKSIGVVQQPDERVHRPVKPPKRIGNP